MENSVDPDQLASQKPAQGLFCPSRPHSQLKKSLFFPIPRLIFPIKKSKKKKKKKIFFYFFLETTTTNEKHWPISEWYLNTCA